MAMRLARVLRIASGTLATLALLFAALCVWRVVGDYQMQVRNHWDVRCYDIIIPLLFAACFSVVIAGAAAFAYRRSTAWEQRLHGTRQV
jgi:hypothetical protein